MKPPQQNETSNGPLTSAEETLRMLAGLPTPEGLVERVQTRLQAAPLTLRVIQWPVLSGPISWMMNSSALRGAAAAAIVVLVTGTGWQIYSHVQPLPTAHVAPEPARLPGAGGFSSAGAMRTPDTLNGPVLTPAVAPEPAKPEAAPTVDKRPQTQTKAKRHKHTAPAAPQAPR